MSKVKVTEIEKGRIEVYVYLLKYCKGIGYSKASELCRELSIDKAKAYCIINSNKPGDRIINEVV